MVTQINYASLLPRCSYKDFLLGLQNTLNIIFRFRNDGKVDIIDRNEILSGAAIDIGRYQVGNWLIGEQKDVSLKFVPEYDDNDARYNSGFTDLSDRAADYGAPVADYDALLAIASPVIGELRRVIDTGKIYEYKWKVVRQEDQFLNEIQLDALGWQFVSNGPQPYIYGTASEEEEIKSVISALQHDKFAGFFFPAVNQRGNLSSMKNVYEDFSLRLLATDPLLLGSQAGLYWDDANGLFATRWSKWSRFWATRLPVEASFQFPLNVLLHVNGNIFSKFSTTEGEFIIEEISTVFGMNHIGETTIKGYKV
jgi:hypothetical protein